jgi:hypothetical protein
MHDAAVLSEREATTCGCGGASRWQCLACGEAAASFLACNRRCLRAHERRRHAGRPAPSPEAAARQALREGNRLHQRNWALYEGHRLRLTRLLAAVQRGQGLCVLGAGNCDDLDLPRLVLEFGEVHLVDLDGEALERGLARVPASLRARIATHAGVDLTGLLGSVERWGDDFPDERGFRERAPAAVAALAAGVGRTFDVVLSDCVASQLCVPFYRLLAARWPEWAALMQAVARVHVATMAALLRPEGTGVLVGDVPLTLGPGERGPAAAPSWDTLDAEVQARLREGVALLRRPDYLVDLVAGTPALEGPKVTEPWRWEQEDAVMLAYGVLFRRAAEPEVRS